MSPWCSLLSIYFLIYNCKCMLRYKYDVALVIKIHSLEMDGLTKTYKYIDIKSAGSNECGLTYASPWIKSYHGGFCHALHCQVFRLFCPPCSNQWSLADAPLRINTIQFDRSLQTRPRSWIVSSPQLFTKTSLEEWRHRTAVIDCVSFRRVSNELNKLCLHQYVPRHDV